MIVELRGINTVNKGAELMMRSMVRELADCHDLAVEPRVAPYRERAQLGLLQKLSHRRIPDGVIGAASRAMPPLLGGHLRKEYGIVSEADVGGVLDASGFAYSDQFDVERCEIAARRAERWRRLRKAVVLMPQAFGPFTSERLRKAFVRLVDNADLVFARERISYEYVLDVAPRSDHVHLTPDFTCLLPGELPEAFVPNERLAYVVPSAKLLTKTSAPIRDAYLPFMVRAADRLRAKGFDVQLLVHERNDAPVVAALQGLLPFAVPVVRLENAVHIKGLIGAARVIVASRYHALVSALSQGVPSLGIGWSHKYETLFDDYGCKEFVVDPTIDDGRLSERLDSLTNAASFEGLVPGLKERACAERMKVAKMWDQVRQILGAAGT
jgi:colanic acid/amylovoran biosynthesis protein